MYLNVFKLLKGNVTLEVREEVYRDSPTSKKYFGDGCNQGNRITESLKCLLSLFMNLI